MTKRGGDNREGHFEGDSGMVAKRFSKRVRREIALKAGFATPGFDQSAGVRDCYGGISILSAEQCGLFVRPPAVESGEKGGMDFEPALYRGVHGPVNCAQAVFTAFFLFQPEGIPGLETLHLTDCQGEQVADPEVGVDSDGEEGEVAGFSEEDFANFRNIFEFANGVHGNAGTGLRVVEVLVFLHWGLLLVKNS